MNRKIMNVYVVAEDEVEVDDVKQRRRKMMMLRTIMVEAQDGNPHFARACTVTMHLDMSQEPLFTEFYWKNAVPQNRGADFVRACAVEIHFNIS